jgi:tRNA modification GTPase
LKRALEAVIASGARPAAPGEFTRRAFLAGRIDLVQAEAVADLIASETEAAARAAAAQLEGALSQRLSGLRRNLAELLALIEAGIDFADEEDMTAIAKEELDSRLRQAAAEIAGLLKDAARGRRLREGARVVIAGSVNVGKSTLMNALLGRERVIVTASPGTTRDVVEDGLDIMGLPVRLFDTAGIRTGSDEVEQMGVDRARAALASGDLAVLVLDGGRPLADDDRVIAGSIPGPMVAALNKRDLPLMVTDAEIEDLARGAPVVKISALFGEGLEELEREIARALTAGATGTETPALTNARHAQALGLCAGAIERARTAARQGLSHEFMAADLRIALDHLGEITGETAAEEILDLIFSRFCIGK